MITRKYRLEDGQVQTTFNGFDRNFSTPPKRIALLRIEDTTEVFALDDGQDAVEEFYRYLAMQELYPTDCKLLGIYEQVQRR